MSPTDGRPERRRSGVNIRRCGVNMRRFCADHEALVRQRLTDGALEGLLAYHERRLRWLQHERLVHLIVMCLVSLVFLFAVGLTLALSEVTVLLLVAVTGALLGAYIRHYFFLENTVQAWYLLYAEIERAGDI